MAYPDLMFLSQIPVHRIFDDAFEDMKLKAQFLSLLENAYEENLLVKDIKQMKINEKKVGKI